MNFALGLACMAVWGFAHPAQNYGASEKVVRFLANIAALDLSSLGRSIRDTEVGEIHDRSLRALSLLFFADRPLPSLGPLLARQPFSTKRQTSADLSRVISERRNRHHSLFARQSLPCQDRSRSKTSSMAITAEVPLDLEELEALAGIWTASLDLDDGSESVTVVLSKYGKLQVQSPGDSALVAGSWEASAPFSKSGTNDTRISMSLAWGSRVLSGSGMRCLDSADADTDAVEAGLRCATIRGVVLEGVTDSCCVGRFNLTLTMPFVEGEELADLTMRYQAKVAARPASPAKFSFQGFIGRWRLLLAFEDASVPIFETLTLSGNHRFVSDESGGVIVGGKWGVWDEEAWRQGGEIRRTAKKSIALLGTHLWLEVDREACKGTSLMEMWPAEDFSLWGRPTLGSLEAELNAMAVGNSSSDNVNGQIYFGDYGTVGSLFPGGRFSLVRESDSS